MNSQPAKIKPHPSHPKHPKHPLHSVHKLHKHRYLIAILILIGVIVFLGGGVVVHHYLTTTNVVKNSTRCDIPKGIETIVCNPGTNATAFTKGSSTCSSQNTKTLLWNGDNLKTCPVAGQEVYISGNFVYGDKEYVLNKNLWAPGDETAKWVVSKDPTSEPVLLPDWPASINCWTSNGNTLTSTAEPGSLIIDVKLSTIYAGFNLEITFDVKVDANNKGSVQFGTGSQLSRKLKTINTTTNNVKVQFSVDSSNTSIGFIANNFAGTVSNISVAIPF